MSQFKKSADKFAASDHAAKVGTLFEQPSSPALGAIFMEIAAHAHTATEILYASIAEGGCVNLDIGAISVLQKVGWLADSMVRIYGGAAMCGEAEDWMLSPLARSSLAALRGQPVVDDAGEGGAA